VAVVQPIVLMDQGGSVMNVITDGTVGTLRRETHGHEPSVIHNMAVSGPSVGVAQPIPSADITGSLTVGHHGCAGHQHRQGDTSFLVTQPLDTDGGTQAVVAPTLTASNDPSRSPQSSEVTNQVAAVLQASMAVRRLTPVECERLQGFPDNYTNIPWRKSDESPDGPRYKALGNSMAVPVMGWIGNRIHQWNEKKRKNT
jgi:DNA (cytosine-5)-methyltransferase 1